jgi:hypothetical protein
MCLFRDIRNSVHEKSHGISRNYMTRNSAEFRRNFSQFRTEYGIDGSKKSRWNSVSTEFRGHPSRIQLTEHPRVSPLFSSSSRSWKELHMWTPLLRCNLQPFLRSSV